MNKEQFIPKCENQDRSCGAIGPHVHHGDTIELIEPGKGIYVSEIDDVKQCRHFHSYKVLESERYEGEIMFTYMTCDCGSVIKVKPKAV